MKLQKFCLLLGFLIICSCANASENIHVTAIEEFKTASPTKNIDVEVVEDSALGSYTLHSGDILHCNVVKIISPKRGKRSASFVVTPYSYTSEENTVQIKEQFSGKYSSRVLSKEELKNIDAAKVGKKAALTVGNHFVKGLSPVASLAKGMIKNEEGNRLQSGVKQVYEDSVLSYAEKGKDLIIEPGQSFYLTFKSVDSDDLDSDEE